jgi:hypothetical protein
MRFYSAVICILAVTACSEKSPSTPSPVARELVLAPGQTASVEEAGIALRFDGVAGDSRCPADAMCVQGGDAQVQVVVLAGDAARSYALHTGTMRPVTHEDLTIALVELSPYPFSSRTIRPDEYRATLRISR